MTSAALSRKVEIAHRLYALESSASLRDYLRRVVIDARPEPLQFGRAAFPWQWELADHVVPMLEAVAGYRADYHGPRNFFGVMPRGHDKTSFIGRCLNGILAFGKRRLSIAAGAGDTDQARLLLEAMESESRLNPWLGERLEFGRYFIRGPGGDLRILSADAPSSFGRRDDVVVIDELTHWQKPDLFRTLWSGRAKRPGSVFIVITNAGALGSWQDKLYRQAHVSPRWSVFAPEGRLPTWMSPEDIEALRAMLPPGLARRVIDNEWVDPAEESGYLLRTQISACVDESLAYRTTGQKHPYVPVYYLGIDYGPQRDRTALCVLHREHGDAGRIVVDRLDVWQGSPEARVSIARVESWVDEQLAAFGRTSVLVVDPYQLEGTSQEYEKKVRVVRHEARGGKANYEMAEALRGLVINRRIAWYPTAGALTLPDGREETLTEELAQLVIRQMPYGYRFDHEAAYHDDRACSVGMAALYCARDYVPVWVPPENAKPPERAPLKNLLAAQNRGVYGVGAGR